tara:strand:+ start:1288 stop:1548 length:261 start_codon:yes stop_codon:yes gene_type:complete
MTIRKIMHWLSKYKDLDNQTDDLLTAIDVTNISKIEILKEIANDLDSTIIDLNVLPKSNPNTLPIINKGNVFYFNPRLAKRGKPNG